jgi:hypothetical protein
MRRKTTGITQREVGVTGGKLFQASLSARLLEERTFLRARAQAMMHGVGVMYLRNNVVMPPDYS